MKVNKQLTSSTNSKQIINISRSIKNITVNNSGVLFNQDKSKPISSTQTCITSMMSTNSKIQTTNINSSRNETGSFVSQIPKKIQGPQSNYLNSQINQSKLLQDIKEKQNKIAITPSLKETSLEKIMKANAIHSVANNSNNKFGNSNISPQSNSQVEQGNEIDLKIPSLKSTSKSKSKIISNIKDVKISMVGSNIQKPQGSFMMSNGMIDTSTPEKQVESSVVLTHNIFNKDKQFSKTHHHNMNFNFEEMKDHESQIQYASNQVELNDAKSIPLTASTAFTDNDNSKSNKRKTNINITNNYNSNINVNTFSPQSSVYCEFSKKILKQPAGLISPKGYLLEETLGTDTNTEEKSSRRRANHKILESENPEDLHFIQVEMLLQSKLISKNFEGRERERSPKIASSNLPALSVIPLDEIDI